MKAVLVRTCSSPSMVPGSPRISVSVASSLFFGESKSSPSASSPSLHLQIKDEASRSIRRVKSESDFTRSLKKKDSGRSRSFPTTIPEEEEEELDFIGGGAGKGKKVAGGNRDSGGGGDGADQSKIGDYYQKLLKANPGDPLLLRNYGQYLHQVEKDTVRAEEYYERAILASKEDGEVLSLYGKLIWETHRDEARANSYFELAAQASPNDCYVMGSYANFLWDAEEDEEQIGTEAALVEAF